MKHEFKICGFHRTYLPCSPLVKCRMVLADVLFERVGCGQFAGDAGESLSYTKAQFVQIA